MYPSYNWIYHVEFKNISGLVCKSTKVKVTSYIYNPTEQLDFMEHLSPIQGMSMHRKESFTLRGVPLKCKYCS